MNFGTVGKYCVNKLIMELNTLAHEYINETKKNQEMEMNDNDNMNLRNATCRYWCKQDLRGKTTR